MPEQPRGRGLPRHPTPRLALQNLGELLLPGAQRVQVHVGLPRALRGPKPRNGRRLDTRKAGERWFEMVLKSLPVA